VRRSWSSRRLLRLGGGAAANLHAEDPGWNFHQTSRAATAEWNGVLSRIAVSGGPRTDARVFYTALYHSLLFPSVFSDDDGRYMGFDTRSTACPRDRCSTRTFPSATSTGRRFPSWPCCCPAHVADGPIAAPRRRADKAVTYPSGSSPTTTPASGWDSVDPIIADAYAYGARSSM